VRLADVIGRWIGKMEVVLAGADDDLREGEEALAAGDAMGARAAAHRVLVRAPESPLGLALLADACESGHLDAELAMTLEQLAARAPSRAEVWLRLARARLATDSPVEEVRDPLVRALAVAEAGSDARREALLGLADLDLAQGEAARAELWLERAAPDASPDVEVRRAEVHMLRGEALEALRRLEPVSASPADGRAALVRGRALAALGNAEAFAPLVRAMVLDAPGASEALSSALALVPADVQTRTRVRSVVDAKGEQERARWRAAFARAEGAREAARGALRDAVDAGDTAAARPLLEAAIEDRDAAALGVALAAIVRDRAAPEVRDRATPDGELLLADVRQLAAALAASEPAHALDALGSIAHARLVPWAEAIAAEAVARWIPPAPSASAWPEVLARLDAHAHAASDLATAARLGALATERSGPVRLAVVGEFNAGKSTFINALIGADVAPTGVLPTTATLHHLRWAPDPFAKILFARGHVPPERVVALGELRAALRSEADAPVARVEIRMPLPALVRVEILDTPGFNAPDARHAEAARAAFEEADIALWLLDATQAMKQSERSVLEDAQRARLPVQMLVNKADRLGPADLARVMASVTEALEQTRIASWEPPVALSAKRALAGKLGDARALDESGWPAVDALLETQIVARSDELKERALRRRAGGVVATLVASWKERAAAEAATALAAATLAHQAAQAAAGVEREADELSARLAASLLPDAEGWARDVNLVFVGRDPEAAARDPVLARYRVDRAVAALALPLARALASLVPEVRLVPDDLLHAARAIVRATAWGPSSDPSSLVRAIARSAVATLAEYLFAQSSAAPPTGRAAGVVRELRAFATALGETAVR
jgi:GTP-binding protein EngB required for normal cell division